MASLNGKPAIRDHLREAAIVQSRLVMISFLVIILALILIARLAYLQINQYERFLELANNNRVDTRPIAPVRGLIFDRNGQPLAINERAYNLEILPRKVDDMDALIASIRELIDLSDENIEHFKQLVKYRPSFQRQVLRVNLSESEAARYSAHQHELGGSYLVAALQRRYPDG
jgi:penicillin-binding protein 2